MRSLGHISKGVPVSHIERASGLLARALPVLCAAAVLALSSCAGRGRAQRAFTFALASEVDDYNPFTNLTADGRSVLFNVYEGLVRVESNEEAAKGKPRFAPCLADSWEAEDGGAKWTFHIREGALFHDGSQVTAHDVSRSLIMAREAGFAGCGNIASAVPLDDGSGVAVTLKTADTSFAAAMTSAIVKDGGKCEGNTKAPLGTGAYTIEEYKAGDAVTLSRYEGYYGQKPSLDRVTVKFAGSQAALPLLFLSGSIDGFVATGDISSEISDDKAVKYTAPSNAVQMLAFNCASPQFQDVRVRRAVRALIDEDEVIAKAASGYGSRAVCPVIPALMENGEALLNETAYNREYGVETLRDAGELSFSITVPSNYTVHVKAAEVITDMLSKAGVKCNIKQVDWATWLSDVYMDRNYEATIISVDAPLATAEAFLARYESSAPDNFVNFKSASYDAALSSLRNAMDEKDKAHFAKMAAECLVHDAASVWIEDIEQVTVYNKCFEGFRSYPLFALDLSAVRAVPLR